MSTVTEQLGIYYSAESISEQTEDWVPVAAIDWGGGYDWEEFHSFYNPSARQFFWVSGSGCSCDSIADNARTVGDFEHGDRAALIRAINAFADESYRQVAKDVVGAHAAVMAFRPEVSA